MFVFKRRSHKSKKAKPVEPEVLAEVPEEAVQLQNLIKRRTSSHSQSSPSRPKESEPDFKDALYKVMEKRKKKLAKKNKAQINLAQTVAVDVQPKIINADSKPSEKIVNIDTVNESVVKANKPRKKKTETSEASASETIAPKKKSSKPQSNQVKQEKIQE